MTSLYLPEIILAKLNKQLQSTAMNTLLYTAVFYLQFVYNQAVRLHTIFQYIDGFKSEHNLQGFLHVGDDYAIFLRKPNAHDKFLTYELYEAKKVPDPNINIKKYKPKLLAISKVPVIYLKEQLKVLRQELFTAKYVDHNAVPGVQVETLREWQINKALSDRKKKQISLKSNILRTMLL